MPAGYCSSKKAYLWMKEQECDYFTPKQIGASLNIAYTTAYQALHNLKRSGLVERTDRAQYRLSEKAKSRDHFIQDEVVQQFRGYKYPIEIWPVGKFLEALQKAGRERSISKGLEFSIVEGYLLDLWEAQDGRCALTGIPMTTVRGNGWQVPANASMDRVDNSKGYVVGNVRLICWQANMMRGQLTDDELIIFCKLIFEKSNNDRNGKRQ